MMFPGHRGLTANEFFPWRGLLAAVAPALVWLLPFASAGGMIALRIGRKEGWRSGLPFRTALLRGGALCIVGTILLTWIRPLAIRLPAVIMIAAGIASVVLAWRERRAADVAESNALAKAQPEHSTC